MTLAEDDWGTGRKQGLPLLSEKQEMECVVVEKISRFIGTLDVNADDATCFHGIAQRSGVWYPNEPDAWANLENVDRLEVARMASQEVPRLTKPASQLVVTEELAYSVQWGHRIQLEKVGFVKQVAVDYTMGPEGWRKFIDRYHGKSLYELLREFPDDPSYSKPKLFEVRVWRLVDAVSDQIIKSRISSSRADVLEDLELVPYAAGVVQEFGAVWHRGRIILSKALFTALDSAIDRRFFKCSVLIAK